MRRAARLALLALLAAAAPGARAGVPPAYGGTIRIALPAAPVIADPARAIEPSDLALVRALHQPLLAVDGAGALAPALLAEVPVAEEDGRRFRLTLAPGLRFADGSPLLASDVAASLTRLLAADPPSPHAWVALPVAGADAVLAGRAESLAGIELRSDHELILTLAFPLPELPWALAALPAAVVSPGGAGAGPFRPAAPGSARLEPNPHHHRGRPFADGLVLSGSDPRAAGRALSAGEVELVVRPEPVGGARTATALGPPLRVTAAAVNAARLGPTAPIVREVLSALDRAELARLFVRGPAAPLATLVPPAILPGARPQPADPRAPRPGARRRAPLALLVRTTDPAARAVAARIQVKLFDRGLAAAVEVEGPARHAARLDAGEYDVALVTVPVLGLRPALAAGQVAFAARGPDAGRRALAELAGLAPAAARERADGLGRALDLVPLFAAGDRLSAAPRLRGVVPLADGTLDPGDLWLLGGGR